MALLHFLALALLAEMPPKAASDKRGMLMLRFPFHLPLLTSPQQFPPLFATQKQLLQIVLRAYVHAAFWSFPKRAPLGLRRLRRAVPIFLLRVCLGCAGAVGEGRKGAEWTGV